MNSVPITSGHINAPTTLRATYEPCPTIRGAHFGKCEALRLELLALHPGEMLPHYVPYHWQALKAAKQLGIKVRTRKDRSGCGVRVWRIS